MGNSEVTLKNGVGTFDENFAILRAAENPIADLVVGWLKVLRTPAKDPMIARVQNFAIDEKDKTDTLETAIEDYLCEVKQVHWIRKQVREQLAAPEFEGERVFLAVAIQSFEAERQDRFLALMEDLRD
jgi:hypothetical protein